MPVVVLTQVLDTPPGWDGGNQDTRSPGVPRQPLRRPQPRDRGRDRDPRVAEGGPHDRVGRHPVSGDTAWGRVNPPGSHPTRLHAPRVHPRNLWATVSGTLKPLPVTEWTPFRDTGEGRGPSGHSVVHRGGSWAERTPYRDTGELVDPPDTVVETPLSIPDSVYSTVTLVPPLSAPVLP